MIVSSSWDVDAVAPLIVAVERDGLTVVSNGKCMITPPRRYFYFWFFGFVARLPYEREI